MSTSQSDAGVWNTLKALATDINDAGGPGAWVREHIVLFIVGAIFELTFQVADRIAYYISLVADSFLDALAAAYDGIGMLGGAILGTRTDPGLVWQLMLAVDAAADAAGPLGILVWAAFIAAVVGLTVRLLPPALNAVGDTLAGIPIVGGALSGLVTIITSLLPWGDG